MQLEKHKDKRGVIEDLYVGKDFSVTRITFKKGAVRGNHYHKKTKQCDFIISGWLEVYGDGYKALACPGEVVSMDKNKPHAYRALEDSEMISICIGKRIGKNYEKDTFRLKEPLV